MKFSCTVQRLANGLWLARQTGSTVGLVEITAPTREEALAKMRNELRYRMEYCPCTGVTDNFVELHVSQERSRP